MNYLVCGPGSLFSVDPKIVNTTILSTRFSMKRSMAGPLNKLFWLILGLTISQVLAASQEKSVDIGNRPEKNDASLSNILMFQGLFQIKRSEQKAAVQRILETNDVAKQSKLVGLIVSKVMEVLLSSLKTLESKNHVPGSSFPEDENTRDAISSLLENTAFLGDLILYLPDISQPLLKKNSNWSQLFLWSLNFCRRTPYIDEGTKTLYRLVAQEMNLIPREPNYTNPYAKSSQTKQAATKPPAKKARKKISKGPSLSGRRSEL